MFLQLVNGLGCATFSGVSGDDEECVLKPLWKSTKKHIRIK